MGPIRTPVPCRKHLRTDPECWLCASRRYRQHQVWPVVLCGVHGFLSGRKNSCGCATQLDSRRMAGGSSCEQCMGKNVSYACANHQDCTDLRWLGQCHERFILSTEHLDETYPWTQVGWHVQVRYQWTQRWRPRRCGAVPRCCSIHWYSQVRQHVFARHGRQTESRY